VFCCLSSACFTFPASARWNLFKKSAKTTEDPVISQDQQNLAANIPDNGQTLLEQPIDKEIIIQTTETVLPNQVSVEIVADEIFYNQEQNYYEAKGNAEAFLPDRNARLYADTISYDTKAQLIEALGEVKVIEKANEIYGSYASFNINANTMGINEPKLFINGLKLKARVADSISKEVIRKGKKETETRINFDDGVLALDQPVALYTYGSDMITRYSREIQRYQTNRIVDWNDLSDKSGFKYSAKEIYVDNTRKTNNLRIKGARIQVSDKFSIPAPVEITTSVGEGAQTRFKGPIFGNQIRIGGFNLGPRFYYERDHGVYSFVPLFQIGDGPSFGGGAIASFNTPNDRTALQFGYGSLHNRVIASLHQDIIGKRLRADALVNQFDTAGYFGKREVGQLYQLSSDLRIRNIPFIDENQGLKMRISGGWAKDNIDLYNAERREDLSAERDSAPKSEHSGFRSEVETSFYTEPIARFGNELYNATMRMRGQGFFRFYDTGDIFTMARGGPALEARVDNFSFELDYLFATIQGESPFLYDQFVDGSQAVLFDGDYKINRWFSIGTSLTYNVGREAFVRNEVRTELGPQDFKLRLSYDTVRNQIGLGFNVLYGDPVEFDNLQVKM